MSDRISDLGPKFIEYQSKRQNLGKERPFNSGVIGSDEEPKSTHTTPQPGVEFQFGMKAFDRLAVKPHIKGRK